MESFFEISHSDLLRLMGIRNYKADQKGTCNGVAYSAMFAIEAQDITRQRP